MRCVNDVVAPSELSLFTCVVSVIIAFVSVLGNGIIIMAVVRDPLNKLHTPFNYFLVNLAVSDLLTGMVCMPISAFVHYKESTGCFQTPWTKALHLTFFISSTSSLLSLIMLSVDRLIAITHAQQYRIVLSFCRCLVISICIWFVSFTFSLIYILWNYIGYLMFFAHSAVIIGLVTISIVSVLASTYLRRKTSRVVESMSSTTPSYSSTSYISKQLLMEQKVTRAFMVMLCVFIAFYIPAVLMIYVLQFCKICSCDLLYVLRDLQFLLVSSNSCVNPFIYSFRITQFRDSVKSFFYRRIKNRVSFVNTLRITDTRITNRPNSASDIRRGMETK